jgi:hypothetical protein
MFSVRVPPVEAAPETATPKSAAPLAADVGCAPLHPSIASTNSNAGVLSLLAILNTFLVLDYRDRAILQLIIKLWVPRSRL